MWCSTLLTSLTSQRDGLWTFLLCRLRELRCRNRWWHPSSVHSKRQSSESGDVFLTGPRGAIGTADVFFLVRVDTSVLLLLLLLLLEAVAVCGVDSTVFQCAWRWEGSVIEVEESIFSKGGGWIEMCAVVGVTFCAFNWCCRFRMRLPFRVFRIIMQCCNVQLNYVRWKVKFLRFLNHVIFYALLFPMLLFFISLRAITFSQQDHNSFIFNYFLSLSHLIIYLNTPLFLLKTSFIFPFFLILI